MYFYRECNNITHLSDLLKSTADFSQARSVLLTAYLTGRNEIGDDLTPGSFFAVLQLPASPRCFRKFPIRDALKLIDTLSLRYCHG